MSQAGHSVRTTTTSGGRGAAPGSKYAPKPLMQSPPMTVRDISTITPVSRDARGVVSRDIAEASPGRGRSSGEAVDLRRCWLGDNVMADSSGVGNRSGTLGT